MRKTWGVNGEIKGTLKTKVGFNKMYTIAKESWERERERERCQWIRALDWDTIGIIGQVPLFKHHTDKFNAIFLDDDFSALSWLL